LRRIATTQANFVDFQGTGSREVTHPLWVRACTQPQGAWVLKDESKDHLDILNFAGNKHAYVIVGRMPVVFEKLKATGVEILVDGDPAMRRPYVVMEANPNRFPKANTAGARALADFLLSEKVQQYLANNPANQRGNTPLFFPVSR
jgi:tungstate transport system substrate-binding protein